MTSLRSPFALVALLAGLGLSAPAHAVPPDSVRRTPVVQAVARATPAVATVRVQVRGTSGPFFMFRPEARASEGSGVVVDARGLLLTNAHVVDGAADIQVDLMDGRTFSADVVAADAEIDLAVLRLRGADGLPTIPLGDTDDLLLGETVIAIGNPFGLGRTVSTGVLSSTGRDVNVGRGPKQTYLQTDAAINPGNSGGALVNLDGELIGINTFIQQGAEGVGFAIPVNRAIKIAADLLAYGEVRIPWLGVGLVDVPRGRLRAPWAEGAALVERVRPGGPAASAGLRPGDLITELDGHRITTRADLNARLAERRPGEGVAVTVLRDSATVPLRIAPGAVPRDGAAAVIAHGLGVTVQEREGVLVVATVRPGGSWERAGLLAGDVVLGVDGAPTRSLSELSDAIARALGRHRSRAWFTVARGRERGSIELPL